MGKLTRNHFILLLGAGATASVGYPLMSDVLIYNGIRALPDDSLTVSRNTIEATLKPLIEDIEHYLIRVRGQVTFEAVIDRALRYDQIVEEINRDDRLNDVFFSNQEIRNEAGPLRRRARDLYELSYKVLLNIYGRNRFDLDKEATTKFFYLLNAFRLENSSKKLIIYTTNYDTLWEQIRQTHGSFRFHDLTVSIHDRPTNSPFSLWRLHGCVRYRRTGGGDISYVSDNKIDWDKLEFKAPSVFINGHDRVLGETRLSKLMAIKVGEREPDLGQAPYRRAFARFENDLNNEQKDNVCVVIGFSFRDVNVSHRIFDALHRRYLNKLICIDPFISKREVIDRLCEASGHSAWVNSRERNDFEKRICVEKCDISNTDIKTIVKTCQERSITNGSQE